MDPSQFIAKLAPLAVAEQRRTGVLASITIAQAILESGWGGAAPGNNLFGIKGTGQERTTKEYVNGHFITVTDGFRVYDSWEGSIIDHSNFLVQNSRYRLAGFFERSAAFDYVGAARALQAAGYATDPQYASKLISIIESNDLHKYDVLNEDSMPLSLSQDWQWRMLGDSLAGLYKQGLLSDDTWAKQAYARQLTVSELAWLNTIIFARQHGIQV